MTKTIFVSAMLLSLMGVMVAGGVAVAQDVLTDPGAQGRQVPALTQPQIFARIALIANWVFTALLVLSVFIVLMAAFQFVTAGDNAESLSGARQKLIWAAVGIIIALLARAFPTLIVSALG